MWQGCCIRHLKVNHSKIENTDVSIVKSISMKWQFIVITTEKYYEITKEYKDSRKLTIMEGEL